VCAVGEDGTLAVLDPQRGSTVWRAQSSEPTLFNACTSAHMVVTAGTALALWDARQRPSAPSLVLSTAPGAQAHLASQLLCVAADPQLPHRLVAGASDGTVHLWDARSQTRSHQGVATSAAGAAQGVPPLCSLGVHTADVWAVQLVNVTHGQLLSCSSDGALYASHLNLIEGGGVQHAGANNEPARTLVQLALPINSLELSQRHGMLACASDAQVLTFLDLRS